MVVVRDGCEPAGKPPAHRTDALVVKVVKQIGVGGALEARADPGGWWKFVFRGAEGQGLVGDVLDG